MEKRIFSKKKKKYRRQIENENLLLLFPSFFQKYWLRFKISFFVFYSPTGPLCLIFSIKTFSIMTIRRVIFSIKYTAWQHFIMLSPSTKRDSVTNTQHNGGYNDNMQHCDTQHNNIQHNYIQYDDMKHKPQDFITFTFDSRQNDI